MSQRQNKRLMRNKKTFIHRSQLIIKISNNCKKRTLSRKEIYSLPNIKLQKVLKKKNKNLMNGKDYMEMNSQITNKSHQQEKEEKLIL